MPVGQVIRHMLDFSNYFKWFSDSSGADGASGLLLFHSQLFRIAEEYLRPGPEDADPPGDFDPPAVEAGQVPESRPVPAAYVGGQRGVVALAINIHIDLARRHERDRDAALHRRHFADMPARIPAGNESGKCR